MLSVACPRPISAHRSWDCSWRWVTQDVVLDFAFGPTYFHELGLWVAVAPMAPHPPGCGGVPSAYRSGCGTGNFVLVLNHHLDVRMFRKTRHPV